MANDVLASNAPSWPEHSVTREGIGPISGPNCPVKMSARFQAKPGLPEPEILTNFEAMTANYDVDPFKSPEVLRPLAGERPMAARPAASS